MSEENIYMKIFYSKQRGSMQAEKAVYSKVTIHLLLLKIILLLIISMPIYVSKKIPPLYP